jgi:hypothetical protein
MGMCVCVCACVRMYLSARFRDGVCAAGNSSVGNRCAGGFATLGLSAWHAAGWVQELGRQ